MVRPFQALSPRGRLRRLRQALVEALPSWGMGLRIHRLCAFSENAVFEVRDGAGARFALRVHQPDYQGSEAIEAELDWVEALASAGLPVPRCVRTMDERRVLHLAGPDLDAPRPVVCFRWTPGRFVTRGLRPTHARALGRLAAALHHHAASWPASPSRPRWDADGLVGARCPMGSPLDDPGLEGDAREAVAAFIDRTHAALTALPADVDHFGMVHLDLHFHNVLFHRGRVAAIDFDDCGAGWYAHDLLVPLTRMEGLPDGERLCGAFAEGYSATRSWPIALVARGSPLRAADQLMTYAFCVFRRHIPDVAVFLPRIRARVVALATDPTLPGRG